MFRKLLILSFLCLFSQVYLYGQENEGKRLLYCREDLEITAIYPMSKSNYLVTDYGETPYTGARRIRNAVLRLIGEDGLSKDSLNFNTSIREVIPISNEKAIINGHDFSFTIVLSENRIVRVDSAQKLYDFKWLLFDQESKGVTGNSLKQIQRRDRRSFDKIRQIDVLGVYKGWVVLGNNATTKKGKYKQTIYSVVNQQTKKVIDINPLEKILSDRWTNLNNGFNYWNRNVFFINDTIYFNHPATGKCYQFDVNSGKVSFFSFPPGAEGFWFFTYDYIKKKMYLVRNKGKQFDLFLFRGEKEKPVFLKSTTAFDNYIFHDSVMLTEFEKGHSGKIACFYVVPIYKDDREWD